MPELPDVEVYRRYMNATALHQPVDEVEVPAARLLCGTTPQGLGHALKGDCFESTHRHGKYLFASLDSRQHLVLHFGMTGELKYSRRKGSPHPHAAMRIRFGNGALLQYIAPRKLGAIAVTDSIEDFVSAHELGPDALAIDQERWLELAQGRRGSAKSWLMNQSVIAGIGNIYSDEILFQAKIHPRRALKSLDEGELRRLHDVTRDVLQAAISADAEPSGMSEDFLLPHREEGGHCPRCGSELKKISISGRSAWYCPDCQPSH